MLNFLKTFSALCVKPALQLAFGVLFSVSVYAEESTVPVSASSSESALNLIRKGDVAYNDSDYYGATGYFREGLALFSKVPNSPYKVELADRFALAASQQAKQLVKEGKLVEAKALLNEALSDDVAPSNKVALNVLAELNDPVRTNPALTGEHAEKVDRVKGLLYKAEGAYNLADYDKSEGFYEEVLKIDAYNKAARRGLERVHSQKSDYYQAARDQGRAKLLGEIDEAWESDVQVSESTVNSDIITEFSQSQVNNGELQRKLKSLIIPRVDFVDVDLYEAVDTLRAQSSQVDFNSPEGSKGVQFVVKLPEGSQKLKQRFNLTLNNVPLESIIDSMTSSLGLGYSVDNTAVVIYGFGEGSDVLISKSFQVPPDFLSSGAKKKSEENDDPFSSGESQNSFIGKRLTAKELLEDLGIKFDGGATASFIPATSTLLVKNTEEQLQGVTSIVQGFTAQQPKMVRLEVKLISVEQLNNEQISGEWSIQDTISGALFNGALGGGSVGNGNGIPGLDGSPVTAGNRSGSVAVPDNSIDAVINRDIFTPATFVNNFDPFLLEVDAAAALTAGFSTSTPEIAGGVASAELAPGIFSASAALQPGAINYLLSGLSQKKGTDFIIQPSVVTRSGQLAKVEVGREFTYPTEYDPPELIGDGESTFTDFNGNLDTDGDGIPDSNVSLDEVSWFVRIDGASGLVEELFVNGTRYLESSSAATPSHPTSFESVLIGADLEIEPTISENNQTINLNIRNTYRQFDGFINYGTPISVTNTNIDVVNSNFFDVTGFDLSNGPTINASGTVADLIIFNTGDTFPPGPAFLIGGSSGFEVTDSFSTVTDNNILMPVFDTINSETSVSIHNGATLILGGLMTSNKVPLSDKTPILGDLPLIGGLFKSEVDYSLNKQILIAVTATIIDPTGRPINQ